MRKLICVILAAALALPVTVRGAGPQVPGKSAVLMELTTGRVLYEHNAHEPLAPASVTKVMTLLLIMEAIDAGTLSWEESVVASEQAAAKGGSQVFLKVGEALTVTEMVKAIAVSSANDCACAMAEHLAGSEGAFVEKMNRRAQELGMEDTHFVNCTGLDDAPEAQAHRTSAWDIALMSRELLLKHPDIKSYTCIWMDTIRQGTFGLSNTNKLVRFYPGATGLKTGFTAGAGHCLSASAQREGMELIAVVMGCESSGDRFSACRQLLDYGFGGYALVEPEVEAWQVKVKLGVREAVTAVPGEDPRQLVEKDQRSLIRVEPEPVEAVTAPVSRGQQLGTLGIWAGEQLLARIPLVASESVGRLSFGAVLRQVLERLCMVGSA